MGTKVRKRFERLQAIQTQISNQLPPTVTVFEKKFSWEDSVSGSSVPAWRDKIRRGIQAGSSLLGEKTSINSSPGYMLYEYMTGPSPTSNYRYRLVTGDLCRNIGIPTAPASSATTTAENIAREKFYARLRSSQTSFQGGVALGELHETLRMLRNPAKALRSKVGELYNRILRGQRRAGKTHQSKNRYLSQTWLEGSFGWTPLINDVKDALETLEKRKDYLNRNLVVITGYHSTNSESFDRNTVSYFSGGLGFQASTRGDQKVEIKYRGAVRCDTSNPYVSEQRLWGFSPDNIIPTVWELVPYSFLIDYFTNIGKVLDSFALRKVDLAWGIRTERRLGIYQVVDVRNANSKPQYKVLREVTSIGDYRSEAKVVIRTPISSVPIPEFRFRVPGFATQWLNIGALVRLKARRF